MHRIATDWDHRIIAGTSYCLGGKSGLDDDVDRLLYQIENGSSENKLRTACEIAVAFIRWAQDLKQEIKDLKGR